jgi:2-methylcitrate dehydratase PrpD
VDHQQAQLSTPFAVALALYLSETRTAPISLSIDDFGAAFSNPEVMALSAKVHCEVDCEVEHKTTQESVAARVKIQLNKGTWFEHFIEHPLGCPANPMKLEDVSARFIALSKEKLGLEACLDWLGKTRDVSKMTHLEPLFQLRLQS